MSDKTTKKPRGRKNHRGSPDDLPREVRLDYTKSRPNRFARHVSEDAVVVVLDSDVAKIFRTSKQVNSLLRATIEALAGPRARRTG